MEEEKPGVARRDLETEKGRPSPSSRPFLQHAALQPGAGPQAGPGCWSQWLYRGHGGSVPFSTKCGSSQVRL